MPIAVRDYEWEQNDKMLYITVPLKGVARIAVDIFSTELYIKVHYPPYLFESFLFAPVRDSNSAAEIGNGFVILKLEKVTPGMWPNLMSPDSGDKQVQWRLRDAAVARYGERVAEQNQMKCQLKHDQGQFAVRQQMMLEEEDRNRIEHIKDFERRKATEDLDEWKNERCTENERLELHEANSLTNVICASSECPRREQPVATMSRQIDIFPKQTAVRETGLISVNFTPRVFPTPTRESVTPDEDAWLAKQAEARHIIELDDRNLSEEERNPVWLRDKGNSFFQGGNFQAAINAYTQAIRLDSKLASLYSNRAACHLKLNNVFKCIEDSSKALELLSPPVVQNETSRARAHVRRGTAFCQLQLYAEGLQDYEAALKLDADNVQLRADAERIRQLLQASSVESTDPTPPTHPL